MTQVASKQEPTQATTRDREVATFNAMPRRVSRRRGLVLTDETARHPFRASLRPNVRREIHDIPAESLWRLTLDDVRGFASVYLAATAGVLAFII